LSLLHLGKNYWHIFKMSVQQMWADYQAGFQKSLPSTEFRILHEAMRSGDIEVALLALQSVSSTSDTKKVEKKLRNLQKSLRSANQAAQSYNGYPGNYKRPVLPMIPPSAPPASQPAQQIHHYPPTVSLAMLWPFVSPYFQGDLTAEQNFQLHRAFMTGDPMQVWHVLQGIPPTRQINILRKELDRLFPGYGTTRSVQGGRRSRRTRRRTRQMQRRRSG
jgi:hypothetical protein